MRSFFMLLVATIGLAKQTGSDIPVTSNLADFDADNTPYYVQSDALGAYHNGVNGATSILVANGYNGNRGWRLAFGPL